MPVENRESAQATYRTPKRILCYISTLFFEGGGLTAVSLNYFRQLWSDSEYSDRFVVDFMSHRGISVELLAEVESHGGRYIELPSRFQHPFRHFSVFKKALCDGGYDVLHYNYDSGFDAVELCLLKKYVPVRICHVHNTRLRYGMVNVLLKPCVLKSYTKALACSRDAGVAFYGKDSSFTIVNNAIDVKRFAYNAQIRNEIRARLEIEEDTFVVGNVGRMNQGNQKNHGFLIYAFALFHEGFPKSKLVIVGEGQLMAKWVSLANSLGIADSVIFAGLKTNVNEYLQAFDLFCFPSQWEGLGIVAIEAQASGLAVIASNTLPKESALTPLLTYLPIRKDDEVRWAKVMRECALTTWNREDASLRACGLITDGAYSIEVESHKLAEIYGIQSIHLCNTVCLDLHR